MLFRKVVFALPVLLGMIAGISSAEEAVDHPDSYYTTENAYSRGVKPYPSDRASDDLNKREAERYQDIQQNLIETTTTVSTKDYQCPTTNSLKK